MTAAAENACGRPLRLFESQDDIAVSVERDAFAGHRQIVGGGREGIGVTLGQICSQGERRNRDAVELAEGRGSSEYAVGVRRAYYVTHCRGAGRDLRQREHQVFGLYH